MLFRVVGFHKRAVPPYDWLAASKKPKSLCRGLNCVTAALNGHKAFALNDLHKRVVNVLREMYLAFEAEIVRIKAALCLLLIDR